MVLKGHWTPANGPLDPGYMQNHTTVGWSVIQGTPIPLRPGEAPKGSFRAHFRAVSSFWRWCMGTLLNFAVLIGALTPLQLGLGDNELFKSLTRRTSADISERLVCHLFQNHGGLLPATIKQPGDVCSNSIPRATMDLDMAPSGLHAEVKHCVPFVTANESGCLNWVYSYISGYRVPTSAAQKAHFCSTPACSQEALVTVCVMPTKIHVYYTEVTLCLVHSVDSLVLVGRVSMQS